MPCLSAAPAGAAPVTIGQLAPVGASGCGASQDKAQAAVAEGSTYTVPSTGGIGSWTITSWSTKANSVAIQEMTMKVFRPVGGLTYTAVARDGPRPLTPSETNTFSSNVVVSAGDVLGLHNSTIAAGCSFPTGMGPADTVLSRPGDLPDGQPGTFMTEINQRVNISAVVEPTNSFTIGEPRLNKRKGSATLLVDVPNPGTLTASGRGVRARRAGVTSVAVDAPGTVKLRFKAKGAQRKALDARGRVTLSATITFTPNDGAPNAGAIKLKLKKT